MAASLPFLAFEGATKKNKPQLEVVYVLFQYSNLILFATYLICYLYIILYRMSFPNSSSSPRGCELIDKISRKVLEVDRFTPDSTSCPLFLLGRLLLRFNYAHFEFS